MKNRIVEFPNRYTDQNGNILILTPLPGAVTEKGTEFNKANIFNDITQAILGLPDSKAMPSEAFKLLPLGIIAMWSGAIVDIPAGWALCDGNNGTPNLQDKFIMCAGPNHAINTTGGNDTASIAAHAHTYSGTTSTVSGSRGSTTASSQVSSHSHTYSGTTATAGAATVDIIPPYYTLAYIMRVAITE